MKFETPKMNISMFAAENVVTNASDNLNNTQTVTEAKNKMTALQSKTIDAANILSFTVE